MADDGAPSVPDRETLEAALEERLRIAHPHLRRAKAAARRSWAPGPDPAYLALAALAPVERAAVTIALIRIGLLKPVDAYENREALTPVTRALRFDRTDAHVGANLVIDLGEVGEDYWGSWFTVEAAAIVQRAIARIAKADGLGDLESAVRGMARVLDVGGADAKTARTRSKLLALLEDDAGGPIDPAIFGAEDSWGQTMALEAARIDAGLGDLFRHLSLADSVTPTASWRSLAAKLVRAPGAGPVLRGTLELALTSQPARPPIEWAYEDMAGVTPFPDLEPQNSILVRGAIWAAALLGEPWTAELIGRLGVHYGTSGRTNNVARDERVGNAAAAALGAMSGDDAFAALGRMKGRVTNRNVSKQIAKSLDAAALKAGISPSEILELGVPSLGLDRSGQRSEREPDREDGWTTTLRLVDGGDLERTWTSPAGESAPKPGPDTDPAWVKRIKEADKDLRRELAAERGRVEDLLVETRDWPIDRWRTRYLEHPVTGAFARTLIWQFADGVGERAGLPLDGAIVDPGGLPLDLAADARVRVWHPIDAAEAEIAAWRTFLIEREIRQPFKQAFREVYRLTPAEETTATYSNRFAGHVLLYAQARALMLGRRWATNFLGPFDGGYEGLAKREFASDRIRAEFYHDAIEGNDLLATVRHCTTDQVRFVPTAAGAGQIAMPMALAAVRPIVFSEAMRDVDLFVGVSSVAADQNWQDQGPARTPPFADYFDRSFVEELTSSARVRRDVLARILPGLAIADRCELDERFLRVRGDLRSYRIHLGSGNIYMDPSDRYLCIVPGRGAGPGQTVFLPFDDDPRLSVILSKAVLLAADRKIKDETIIRQIQGR